RTGWACLAAITGAVSCNSSSAGGSTRCPWRGIGAPSRRPDPGGMRVGLWDRLTAGLKKTQEAVSSRITEAFVQVTGEKLDPLTRERLEEALLESDLGPALTDQVLDALEKRRGLATPEAWREALAEELARRLVPRTTTSLAPPPGV